MLIESADHASVRSRQAKKLPREKARTTAKKSVCRSSRHRQLGIVPYARRAGRRGGRLRWNCKESSQIAGSDLSHQTKWGGPAGPSTGMCELNLLTPTNYFLAHQVPKTTLAIQSLKAVRPRRAQQGQAQTLVAVTTAARRTQRAHHHLGLHQATTLQSVPVRA